MRGLLSVGCWLFSEMFVRVGLLLLRICCMLVVMRVFIVIILRIHILLLIAIVFLFFAETIDDLDNLMS